MAGVPALLLPGTLCDGRLFAPMLPLLAAAGIDAAVGDLTRDDSIAAMATRVLEGAPERFALVGFSLGGIVGLEVARRARHRLTHLALVATTPRADTPDRRASRLAQAAAAEGERFLDLVTEELKPRYFGSDLPEREALKALVLDMARDLGPPVFRRQAMAVAHRADAREWLPTLTGLPALAVAGDEDALCPPEFQEEIRAGIPGCALRLLPGCGHMAPLERPAELAGLLIKFLKNEPLGEDP